MLYQFLIIAYLFTSHPAGSDIYPQPKRRFVAQSRSCTQIHRLETTEILLLGT